MKKLTQRQRDFIAKRDLKIGSIYMLPRFGFYVFSKPDYDSGMYMDTNPFTKSLDYQPFELKEIRDNFVRGNFFHGANGADFWLMRDDIELREGIVMLLLLCIFYIPFRIYNLFN